MNTITRSMISEFLCQMKLLPRIPWWHKRKKQSDAPILNLPDELFVLIMRQLEVKDIFSCKKVCRQLHRVVHDNWLQLPRPRVRLEFHRPTPEKRAAKFIWRMYAAIDWEDVDNLRRYFTNALKSFNFTYSENELLVEETLWSSVHSRFQGIQLIKQFFENRGLPCRVSTTELKDKRISKKLHVTISTESSALHLALSLISDYGFRIKIQIKDEICEDAPFYEIIKNFIVNEPTKLETVQMEIVDSLSYQPLLSEMLGRIQDESLHIFLHYKADVSDNDILTCKIKMIGPVPIFDRKLGNLGPRKKKTDNHTHRLLARFAHDPGAVSLIVESPARYIYFEEHTQRDTRRTKEILQKMVKQWMEGSRSIKAVHFWSTTSPEYHLDIPQILSEYSVIAKNAHTETPVFLLRRTAAVPRVLQIARCLQADRGFENANQRGFKYVMSEDTIP